MRQQYILLRRILVMIVPVITVCFGVFYLTHSHAELAQWYKDIYSGFYKAETWEKDFFTEAVKQKGDQWCKLGIALSLVWLIIALKLPYVAITFRHPDKRKSSEYAVIILCGLLFSLVSNYSSYYAFDEVFSAVNFASLPAFQCVSYYALPNNHIMFNALNGLLFSWTDDLVASGRILSMIFFILVLLMSWDFLSKWIPNKWIRAVMLLSLALQFPVWGFSGQARGYEMVLFFSCAAFFSFWAYWVEQKRQALFPLTVCIVCGMLTLPSFLYWTAGLNLAALLMMYGQKKIDWLYIRYMLAGVCMLLICYLPLFSFSGLAAMTDNQYMKATADTSMQFIANLGSEAGYFRKLFTEWFCFDILSRVPGYFLLLLPLAALLNKWNAKPFRPLLKIYFSMLVAFLVVCILLKNMAFSRNMLAHGYLVWMVLLIVLSTLPKQDKIQKAFMVLMLVATVFSSYENYKFRHYGLYYYNVKDRFKSLDSCQFELKPASTVFLDNESFYWWYMLKQKFPDHQLELAFNRPAFRHQDYSILLGEDKIMNDTVLYEQVLECHDFVIYRRRQSVK